MDAAAEYALLAKNLGSFRDLPPPWFNDDGSPFVVSGTRPPPFPPANHPRRCHAPRNHEDRRCRQWAVRGRDYCKMHGGRRRLGHMRAPKMPSRYSTSLMPTLAKRLQDMMDEPRGEQLELFEEIALARTLLDEALRVQSALTAAKDVPSEMLVAAMRMVQDALSHVADLVSKMAKIQRDFDETVTLRQVGFIVEQMARVVASHLGDDPRVDLIAADLRDKVRIPGKGVDPLVEIEVAY